MKLPLAPTGGELCFVVKLKHLWLNNYIRGKTKISVVKGNKKLLGEGFTEEFLLRLYKRIEIILRLS